ncbi:MAG: hypothetical protein AAGA71_15555 [Pseudomonadota bacterium]
MRTNLLEFGRTRQFASGRTPTELPSLVQLVRASDSDRAFVFFAGMGGKTPYKKFQFRRISEEMDIHKVFVKSTLPRWYQGGVNEDIKSIELLTVLLRNVIRDLGVRDVTFVGSSMGGYAALLFAAISGLGRAIAFSPQTFLDPINRLRHFDLRWPREICATWALGVNYQGCLDLVPVLHRYPLLHNATIFYPEYNRLDRLHARRVGGFRNIDLVPVMSDKHNIVKQALNTADGSRAVFQ